MVAVVFILCAGGVFTFYYLEMQRPERVAAREEEASRRKDAFEQWQLDHWYVCNMLLRGALVDPTVPNRAKSKVEEASRKFNTECESLEFEKWLWLRRLEIRLEYNFTSAPGRYWNNEVFLFPEGWRVGDEKDRARMRAILEQQRKQ